MEIIDLSTTLQNNDESELDICKIKYFDHRKGGKLLGLGYVLMFNSFLARVWNAIQYITGFKRISSKDFLEGIGLAWENVSLSTHYGTHLDAPYHYTPFFRGKPSLTIDKVPLEYCFCDGVVLDCREKKAGEEISVEDLESSLKKINYQLKPNDIVLIMAVGNKFRDTRKYLFLHPGISPDALDWLIEKGIKIIGVDSWGLDRPSNLMIEEYLKTKDKNVLWPAHLKGREKEFFHIEKLVNLEKIPTPFGFKVACFPIKIANASAGWSRVVAIIED
jgi:kynurenine formamidase